MIARRRRTSAFLAALVLGTVPAIASARGVASIVHRDGRTNVYQVRLRVVEHHLVRVFSADGRGTLVFEQAACTYGPHLERCLPYALELRQDGRRDPIAIVSGTEYINRGDVARTLPMSSNVVPAHGLLLLVVTARGTAITVRGSIDGFDG